MSSFWGAEVKPAKPYTHTHSARRGRLRLTQATLGGEVGKGEKGGGGGKKGVVLVQCSVKNKDPVFLCALVPGQSETCHLELEFEEKFVTFSVLGPRSVHLAGYYVCDVYEEDMGDSDTGSDSLRGSDDDGFLDTDDDDNMVIIPVSAEEMSTDSEDDDSDYDSETDDAEMMYNQRRGKSSVIIEEIQEDDKPAGGEGQKGSNKKQSSENGDNSQLQLVVRTPPVESLESEDEDGFPVSFPESKKSAEGSSKKNRKLNNETSNEDRKRKRKSGVISDHPDCSGEAKAENDGVSKKKKKAKAKRTAVDSEEKESKPQDSPGDPVDAKQKKKKNMNISASEADTDQQVDMENHIDNDAEEVTAQEAKKNKKNKKKKTQEKNASENQASIWEAGEEEIPAASDKEIVELEELEVDLRLISGDDYAVLRHKDQFLMPCNSSNPKFHTKFQEKVFEQAYGQNRKFADHKWIKWKHINDLEKYHGVYEMFQAAGLHDLVVLRNDYNDEIIRQFYATLYISPDFMKMKWMTLTRYMNCTKADFERVLRMTSSNQWEKIYDRHALMVSGWTEHYDRNVRFVPGKINGLLPVSSLINRIINHTILPKSGNFDAVRGHAWNIIDLIKKKKKFDVVDVIIRSIASSKDDRIKRIYHAPYIMVLILSKLEYQGGLGCVHKAYKPREGPPIPVQRAPQAQQNEPEDIAPGETAAEGSQNQATLAQILNNQTLILNNLMQVKVSQQELRSVQQEMRTEQLEFQYEINNRLAALIDTVSSMELTLNSSRVFSRRRPNTPPGTSSVMVTVPQSYQAPASSAPAAVVPPPQDPATQDSASQGAETIPPQDPIA